MSPFKQITDAVSNSADYQEKTNLVQYICTVLKNADKPVNAEDSALLREFAVSEMQKLITAIPEAENYKQKDCLFAYEDGLLGIFSLGGKSMENVSQEQLDVIKQLVALVYKERVLENAIDETFNLAKIEKSDVEKVLEIVKPLTDEYRRGILYQGLHAHKEGIAKFTPEAKSALAEYTAEDMLRLIDNSDDPDKVKSLEFAVDVCKYYADNKVLDTLEKTMALKCDDVRYYAAGTLIEKGREIPSVAVNEMAENLEYAQLLYELLKKHGKAALFPAKYSTPEYLAKSDLVHWLTYPTELGKKPEEIELLGVAKVRGEVYHVFKYVSHSDTLSDDLHGKWLIGWSGDQGGTFSDFNELSEFEKKTPKKTLKNIVKKLLK